MVYWDGGQTLTLLVEGTHHGPIFDWEVMSQERKIMGVEYMQVVLDNLNERFPTNLHIFNASSSFLVHSWSNEQALNMLEQWLEKLTLKFKLIGAASVANMV